MRACSFCGDSLPQSYVRVESILARPGSNPVLDRMGLAIRVCSAECLHGWSLQEDAADLHLPAELIEPLMRRALASVAERASIDGDDL